MYRQKQYTVSGVFKKCEQEGNQSSWVEGEKLGREGF